MSVEDQNIFILESEEDNVNGHFYPSIISGAKSPAAIIIDNGSYRCRSGFSNFESPSLIFSNLLGRVKKVVEGVPYELVGNELDPKDMYRYYLKSPFDNDVVVNFDIQETILDYVFYNLDLEKESVFKNPVILTETLCNPSYSRRCMLEMVFELYRAPSVSFGVDCLFSFNSQYGKEGSIPDNGLVISLSHSAFHIVPRLNGNFLLDKAIRLNTGGKSLYMHWTELLGFANPHTSGSLYPNRIQEIVEKLSSVAEDYFEKVDEVYKSSCADPEYGTFIQFPIYSTNLDTINRMEVTEEEKIARKDIVLLKLYAVHNENRMKKLIKYRDELAEYDAKREEGTEFNEVTEKRISVLLARIESMQKKYDAVLDVLNGKASIEEIKVKKKKLSPEQVNALQNERRIIMERKRKRQKIKEENTGRKKQANRNRMKILTSLAANEREEKMAKKIRNKLLKKEDKFGMNESDWDIYRSVAVQKGFDAESEEEDNEKLAKIDNQLLKSQEPLDPEEEMLMSSRLEDYSKIHIKTEPYRATEGLFRPRMMGMASVPGIVEGIIKVLDRFSYDEQIKISENILLCGGLMKIPGMYERLRNEIISNRPYDSEFKVQTSDNIYADSWVGARKWYNTLNKEHEEKYFAKFSDYQEEGIDRVIEKLERFNFSNIFN